jgi:hypothetical protein
VPSAVIRIDLRIGRFRQGSVDSAALLQPGRSIYSGANQWMTENHSDTKLQQVFRFDGLRNGLGDSELPGLADLNARLETGMGETDDPLLAGPRRPTGGGGDQPSRSALGERTHHAYRLRSAARE